MSGLSERLKKTYERMKADGLQDVKFVFAPLEEKTTDDVSHSVIEALDAVANGEFDDVETFTPSGRPGEKKRSIA